LILTVNSLKVLGPVLAQGLDSRLTVNNPTINSTIFCERAQPIQANNRVYQKH